MKKRTYNEKIITLNISIEKFLELHSDLEILEDICNNCGKPIVANQPILINDIFGLVSQKCTCGKGTNQIINICNDDEYWMDF